MTLQEVDCINVGILVAEMAHKASCNSHVTCNERKKTDSCFLCAQV